MKIKTEIQIRVKITVFFHRQAIKNIFNLLKAEGGDCFLVFLASNPIYDVYKTLSTSNKWSSYMTDVEQFINPLHYLKYPDKEFSRMLKEEGFSDIHVEVKNKFYYYVGIENFIGKSVYPFVRSYYFFPYSIFFPLYPSQRM